MNDLPASLGGENERELLASFGRVLDALGLVALVSAGSRADAALLFVSSALSKWLGRESPLSESGASTLGDVLSCSEAGDHGARLVRAELQHVGGHRFPVLVSARNLSSRGWVIWLIFEAEAERTKLRTLGRQLAHELNNPLTIVLWKLDLVARQLPQAAKVPGRIAELSRHLDEARYGTSRAVDLVGEFAETMQCRVDRVEATDLSEVLHSALYLVQSEVEEVATLVRDFEPVPLVHGHPSKLEQVFSNLLLNAVQAVRAASLPQHHRIRVALHSQPPWVIASVGDTGVGMSQGLMRRIFEPFFTTKAATGGSGLGLFICKEIVESLGGRLEVESALLSGSEFRVHLRSVSGSRSSIPSPYSRRRSKRG